VIRRWQKPAIFSLADQAVFSGSMLLVNILLARWTSPEEFGTFAVLYAVFLIFAGFHNALIVEPMSVFGARKQAAARQVYFRHVYLIHAAVVLVLAIVAGLAVVILLGLIGVDYVVLWGVLAFLLNFIPNIGSIIAAVPAVLLALVQLGAPAALAAAGGYLLINTVVGTFLEPRYMGKGLGLSTLVVFLSLIFWGWVLGPVGMLLSVPLTIAIKIALDSQPNTRWMAIMLGPKIAPVMLAATDRAVDDEPS